MLWQRLMHHREKASSIADNKEGIIGLVSDWVTSPGSDDKPLAHDRGAVITQDSSTSVPADRWLLLCEIPP